jgi:hypothetical protein
VDEGFGRGFGPFGATRSSLVHRMTGSQHRVASQDKYAACLPLSDFGGATAMRVSPVLAAGAWDLGSVVYFCFSIFVFSSNKN